MKFKASLNSPLLLVLRVSFLLALTALAQAGASKVQIRESSVDRAVTLQTEAGAGGVPYLAPVATGKSRVVATLALKGVDVAAFDENTRFELVVGRHSIAKRLGDDPNYRKGSTSATFTEVTSRAANEQAPASTDSRVLQLKWSAKRVKATLTLLSNDLERAPWAMGWAGPMRWRAAKSSLSSKIAGHIAFGSQASSAFKVKTRGKRRLTRSGQLFPDLEPVMLSSVTLTGSGKGSRRASLAPRIERISDSELIAAEFQPHGGSITVEDGRLKGTVLTVPPDVFPDGTQISVSETKLLVEKNGKTIEVEGLRLSGSGAAPSGGYVYLTIPGMIDKDGYKLPFGMKDDGSSGNFETVAADIVSGSVQVRWRVPQSPNDSPGPQPAARTLGARSANTKAAKADSWEDEAGFVAPWFGVGSGVDWFEGDGGAGWLAGLKRDWDDYWNKREEPENEPIETPGWRDAIKNFKNFLSDLNPWASVDDWESKKNSFREVLSEMRSEEGSNNKFVAETGFSPRSHGFATSSGGSTYFSDTSGGMVRFAHWAFKEKGRLPLHDLYKYPADISFGSKTAQDVIAARASASESGQLAVSPSWIPGVMRYGQVLTKLFLSRPVPLMVSKVDSTGKFVGLRHLLAYGILHVAGTNYSPRIRVYDPSAPGNELRLVRYHPDYGMFYEFPDGDLGVDVRCVSFMVSIGSGPAESLSRIHDLAQMGRLNGISEIQDFSIPQGEYVAESPAQVKFTLQDGGELPVRRIFVNDQQFDVPIENTLKRRMSILLAPGPNLLELSAYGRADGKNLPLHHPAMTDNPRKVHYMKMPLRVTKTAGDKQTALSGGLELPQNLEVAVIDANGKPVPFPTLKWSIVDPGLYGGGLLESVIDDSTSGTSWEEFTFHVHGSGWARWTLGTQKNLAQQVSVEVVGVAYQDMENIEFHESDIEIKTSGPAVFDGFNGRIGSLRDHKNALQGFWNVEVVTNFGKSLRFGVELISEPAEVYSGVMGESLRGGKALFYRPNGQPWMIEGWDDYEDWTEQLESEWSVSDQFYVEQPDGTFLPEGFALSWGDVYDHMDPTDDMMDDFRWLTREGSWRLPDNPFGEYKSIIGSRVYTADRNKHYYFRITR